MNAMQKMWDGAKARARAVDTYNKLLAMGLAVSPGFAMATGEFDESTIVTKIETYGAKAVLIVGAFLLAIWGLRAMGILKSK